VKSQKDLNDTLDKNSLFPVSNNIVLLPIDAFIRPITLVLDSSILKFVLFKDLENVKQELQPFYKDIVVSSPNSFQAGIQFVDYFKGKRQTFDLPLDPQGTSFQKNVWSALREIKFGETMSYGVIAKKLGNPNAYRAVGSSCGKNPLPIIIPCHRVLAHDGKLGGFSGGLDIKKALLSLEKNYS